MKHIPFYLLTLLSFFASCSSDGGESTGAPEQPGTSPADGRMAVRLVTRAPEGESGAGGMQAGLYMVNRTDGQPATLQAGGNYVNNLLMNYSDGSWVPTASIYWKDTNISADFYAYTPYAEEVADARAMAFRVATDQTSDEAVEQSDLLWGTVQDHSPLDGSFSLMLGHQLSRLTVEVMQGTGFSDGELTAANVSVAIGGSKTLGTVDLQTGTVTATDEVADVKCHNNGDLTYTAILLPQQIPFANLIQVNWNGSSYTLQRSFGLEQMKQYKLTIKLNKTQGGINVGISGWDIIGEDFGGTVG